MITVILSIYMKIISMFFIFMISILYSQEKGLKILIKQKNK